MTEPTRQLPGVKGQWILCSECPPTEADADEDGDVFVWPRDKFYRGRVYESLESVEPNRYWRPNDYVDHRPFTLPAAPAPGQAAVGARLFDKLTGNADGSLLWAVADDGTAWERDRAGSCTWEQFPPLPPRDA